jgi:hypothetical protein
MTNANQNTTLEDVLNAFSVEPSVDRETLERYLRSYPQFAESLLDLSRELHRELRTDSGPLSAEDEALVDAAWRRHAAAAGPQAQADVFENLSTQQLRDVATQLDVPRQVVTGFRDRRVILASVPRRFLGRFAGAVARSLEQLVTSITPIPDVASARSFKSDLKPSSGEPVTFERLLIDAGVPEDKRARLLADDD